MSDAKKHWEPTMSRLESRLRRQIAGRNRIIKQLEAARLVCLEKLQTTKSIDRHLRRIYKRNKRTDAKLLVPEPVPTKARQIEDDRLALARRRVFDPEFDMRSDWFPRP